MTSNVRRAFRCALLLFGVLVVARRGAAQASTLSAAAIGQIADEALNALLPPGHTVSRVPVAKRGIRLDYMRTLEAFGHPSAARASVADLRMRTTVTPGPRTLLEDCKHSGFAACRQLGWGVYVWIKPIAVTSSHARVRAFLVWPDRGPVPFDQGVSPTGRALLVGFATEIFLIRAPDGSWKFEKEGSTIVS